MRIRGSSPWRSAALLLTVLLAACTATQVPVATSTTAPGFLQGFWHGLIAPVAFLVSVFSETVRLYAVPNTGIFYDLGFMLGIGGFSGGVFAGSKGQKGEKQ